MTSKTFLHLFTSVVTTGPDALILLQNHLIQKLHAKKIGPWNRIKIGSYHPTDKNLLTGEAYIVEFQNPLENRHCYVYKDEILEADDQMKEIILGKLVRFVPRVSAYIEGDEFECGDFLVRLGYLYVGQQKKAIMIEVCLI
jgi:hypothetical protein